jgi:hypothetical protein
VISRVRPALPRFLAELEQAGITDLDIDDRSVSSAMRARLRSIHVTSCLAYTLESGRLPGFYVYPEATDLWVGDGGDIRLFCEEFLRDKAQADVIAKLAESGADERHAVVIATEDQFGLYCATDMGLKPSQTPDLDRRVDWLWVIARKTCRPGCATGQGRTAGRPHWSPVHLYSHVGGRRARRPQAFGRAQQDRVPVACQTGRQTKVIHGHSRTPSHIT